MTPNWKRKSPPPKREGTDRVGEGDPEWQKAHPGLDVDDALP
jgi:hypothetical protein